MSRISHVQVTIPKEKHRIFSVLAKAKDVTMTSILRDAIDVFIEENANLVEM